MSYYRRFPLAALVRELRAMNAVWRKPYPGEDDAPGRVAVKAELERRARIAERLGIDCQLVRSFR